MHGYADGSRAWGGKERGDENETRACVDVTYPDAGGVLPAVAEQRGDVPAHLAHLRLAPVAQQLHPRRRHPRLRLAAAASQLASTGHTRNRETETGSEEGGRGAPLGGAEGAAEARGGEEGAGQPPQRAHGGAGLAGRGHHHLSTPRPRSPSGSPARRRGERGGGGGGGLGAAWCVW
jgi:hypothetical protein